MSTIVLMTDPQKTLLADLGLNVFTPTSPAHTVCKLFQNNFSPSFPTLVGDFTQADFVGYAPEDLDVWTTPYLRPDQQWEIASTTLASFISGVLTGPQTVYGWYLLDGTGALLLAERFDNPIDITVAGQGVFVLPRVSIADLAGSGVIED